MLNLKKSKDRQKRRPLGFDWSLLVQLFGLISLCIATHFFLVPVGMGFSNSDFAIYPITADWIHQGHWAPFQMNYSYGGVPITLFRVPWVWMVEKVYPLLSMHSAESSSSYVSPYFIGHFSFGFVVVSIALTLSFFYMARQFGSRTSAFISAIVCAVGFNSWLFLAFIDFYNIYLIFGAILLGIRVRYSNPFKELSPGRLFGVSLLAGVAYYGCRASIIYIVVFFLPWDWAKAELTVLFASRFEGISPENATLKNYSLKNSSRSKTSKFLLGVATCFLVLYFYLEAFGGYLGQWNGRAVKLHAGPNFTFAAVALALIWVKRNAIDWVNSRFKVKLAPGLVKRWICVGSGFLLGMSPELFYWFQRGKLPPLSGGGSYSFEQTLAAVGKVPASLQEILGPARGSLLIHATLALFVWSWVVLIQKAKKEKKAQIVLFAMALSLFAYVRVLTYAFAPPRYLLPIFPALIAALTLLFDEIRNKKRFWIACLLVAMHLGLQVSGRLEEAVQARISKRPGEYEEVIQAFRKEQVKWVLSDEYWHSNQYTFASQWNPFFISTSEGFHLPENVAAAKQSSRVGIILAHELQGIGLDRSVTLLGCSWKLTFIKRVGEASLYFGEKE